MSPKNSHNLIERPPVIAIMGHIDHGKSSLLDFIRKSNIVAGEAGGITQHIGAYEVIHKTKTNKESRITFLDTPGHAAFKGIRVRGANVADIAVLVVSGEEGVKPQTLEALQNILAAKIPYIVAISKIDSPKANAERIKQNLAENEMYVEGYGGQIPWVAVSAQTGEGVSDLLDLLLLQAELGELRGDPGVPAEGVVIEANIDKRKGVSATLIIKNGTLKDGMAVVCDGGQSAGNSQSAGAKPSIAPVRIIEDWSGKRINEATFSSPVRLIGFDILPQIGATFKAYPNKKQAEAALEELREKAVHKITTTKSPQKSPASAKGVLEKENEPKNITIALIIKTDVSGTLEAIKGELAKIKQERVDLKIVHSGIGDITENDVKTAVGHDNIFIIGFNCRIDSQAKATAERLGLEIHSFNIIYKLIEWVEGIVAAKTPKVQVEEITGKAKIQKIFSKNKDKQVVGGKVLEGVILVGEEVRILRREAEIGRGKLRELQQQKQKASEAKKDTEFGSLIESKTEIAPGDQIQMVRLVEK